MKNTVMAARRDASWFRNPSTHGPIKFHAVLHAGNAHGLGLGEAGCGTWLDTQFSLTEAESVRFESRCRKPGCWKLWPKTYTAPDGRQFTL